MGNREDYEKKLEEIKGIDGDRLKAPHHIPVDVYIQEAETLYEWAMKDIEALISIGLSRELVEDLPIRIGALIQAESTWYVQRNSGDEAVKRWAKESPFAYDLKKQLLSLFSYAFRDHPDLLVALRQVKKRKGHANMIQALNDLSTLGEKNAVLWGQATSPSS